MIISRNQEPRSPMCDNATNSTRTRRHYRHAREKRLQYRTRHVVDVRTIQENMCFVVKLMHLARRHTSAKLDILYLQLTREQFERRSLWSIASQDQLRLRKPLLNFREGPQDTRHVVKRIHVAIG